ncbi:uncharacterized protein EDB93DRAFT_695181 [Suillus bovinus]|uniref:uncharacterized protein n=1 Tax=Suillus bovinus TaxID=48563 RepID=UPI001B886C27|nr:uncharacterized protein EDB93DRAFT_695181 [Suillus bovinus]KAG2139578.1 hypothetical protein EDB93DRAFT_695181 [Suillus bovinus]
MEYSTDDIAAAKSLQFATYIHTSMATFWIYDYISSLKEEWTFLRRSHWNKMKVLYIVTRYLPFILLATDLYMSFISNGNTVGCQALGDISLGIGMLIVICSECFFILRTYVLWNQNRILLAAMGSTFFSFLVASFSIAFTTTVPAARTCFHLPSGIPQFLKHSVHFHRCDQRDPGNHRVLPEFDRSPALHSISFPFRFRTGTHDTYPHMRHTELVEKRKPSVRCPSEP